MFGRRYNNGYRNINHWCQETLLPTSGLFYWQCSTRKVIKMMLNFLKKLVYSHLFIHCLRKKEKNWNCYHSDCSVIYFVAYEKLRQQVAAKSVRVFLSITRPATKIQQEFYFLLSKCSNQSLKELFSENTDER